MPFVFDIGVISALVGPCKVYEKLDGEKMFANTRAAVQEFEGAVSTVLESHKYVLPICMAYRWL